MSTLLLPLFLILPSRAQQVHAEATAAPALEARIEAIRAEAGVP